MKNTLLNIGIGLLVLIVLSIPLSFIGGGFFGTVRAGERGVELKFNAVTGQIHDEGLYFKWPLIEKVKRIPVKIQKTTAIADAASKDLQTVEAAISLNYRIEPTRVTYIYQNFKDDYVSEIITPSIQESVKAATALFTAEELITKRPEVRDAMKANLRAKLERHSIIVEEFNIENFNFSAGFDAAVEAKVSAEQNALAAKNKLEQVKFEAEQKIEQARGEAEALRVKAQSIQSSPQIIQLEAIEKWNGTMPTFWGGDALPFLNLK